MAYQIPRMPGFVPAERARGPRLLDAAMADRAHSAALRQGKEQEKSNRLGAAVSLLGSAGGEGGWMEMFEGMSDPTTTGEMVDTVDTMENMQGLDEGQQMASNQVDFGDGGGRGAAMNAALNQGEEPEGMSDDQKAMAGVTSLASLATGNPMGLIGLAKLFGSV